MGSSRSSGPNALETADYPTAAKSLKLFLPPLPTLGYSSHTVAQADTSPVVDRWHICWSRELAMAVARLEATDVMTLLS
jgi:hypothetical protein